MLPFFSSHNFFLPGFLEVQKIGRVFHRSIDPEKLVFDRALERRMFSSTFIFNYLDRQLVVKWIFENVEREISIQTDCAASGIAPTIYWSFLFDAIVLPGKFVFPGNKSGIMGIIVMDKMDYELGTFLLHVNEDIFPECRRLKASEVVGAVDKMHSVGICHRDLTLANIMVNITPEEDDCQPRVYIIDYGEAARLSDGVVGIVEDIRNEFQAFLDGFADEIEDRIEGGNADFAKPSIYAFHKELQACISKRV